MQKKAISFTIFSIICFTLFFQASLIAQQIPEIPGLPDLPDLPDLPSLPDNRKNLVILGAFATAEEPILPTDTASKCPTSPFINERFIYAPEEKVFIGLAIANTSGDTKDILVAFNVTGPIILSEEIEATIAPESICLVSTNLPRDVPAGVYKINGIVRGRGGALLKILFDDDFQVPTPVPTPTPAPTPVIIFITPTPVVATPTPAP